MKRISLYGWTSVLLMLLCGGCISRRQVPVTVTPVTTLTADTASSVQLDVNFCIPERTLSARHRLIVVPQLIHQDSVWAEFPPVAVDAPAYARKMRRRQMLHHYVDTLADRTMRVNNRREIILPYRERVVVPEGCEGGRIVGMLSSDGCGECNLVQQVDMAYLSNVSDLMKRPEETLKLTWMDPKFVIRPKMVEGRGEALLQFTINLHNIDLALGNNRREMNSMLAVLDKIVHDSLATLKGVKIDGMASADGSLPFNTRLAANRADAAKRWLVAQLGLDRAESRLFTIGSRPEGWAPVYDAMVADGHADTVKVGEILRKYQDENDDVAERYIRRLSCWNDIKQRYLQKDRKVVYEYSYTLKSFTTDVELLSMYDKRPDAFNAEELLRVASLKQTDAEKEEVYRTLLHYIPESQIAANNLAVLLMRRGCADEAEQVLRAYADLMPEAESTLAGVYVHQKRYDEAADLFEDYTSFAEARYNLGIVRAEQRQWDEAYRWLKEFNDVEAALVSLSVNSNDWAAQQMAQCDEHSPRASYVRAIIDARRGNKDDMLQHLQEAMADESFRQRAAQDTEFVSYQADQAFVDVIKGV